MICTFSTEVNESVPSRTDGRTFSSATGACFGQDGKAAISIQAASIPRQRPKRRPNEATNSAATIAKLNPQM